jgi:hypothetical protein
MLFSNDVSNGLRSGDFFFPVGRGWIERPVTTEFLPPRKRREITLVSLESSESEPYLLRMKFTPGRVLIKVSQN